jgi:hypothetical protein
MYIFAEFSFEAFNPPSKEVKDGTKAKLALFYCKEVSKKYEIKSQGFHVTYETYHELFHGRNI